MHVHWIIQYYDVCRGLDLAEQKLPTCPPCNINVKFPSQPTARSLETAFLPIKDTDDDPLIVGSP